MTESNGRADRRGLAPRKPSGSQGFYAFLPRSAPTTNDLEAARAYYGALCVAIDHGGWTRPEWAGLRRLERRWRRRLNGDDRRWLLVGAKPGRLVRELERALRPAGPVAEWAQPLARGETGASNDD